MSRGSVGPGSGPAAGCCGGKRVTASADRVIKRQNATTDRLLPHSLLQGQGTLTSLMLARPKAPDSLTNPQQQRFQIFRLPKTLWPRSEAVDPSQVACPRRGPARLLGALSRLQGSSRRPPARRGAAWRAVASPGCARPRGAPVFPGPKGRGVSAARLRGSAKARSACVRAGSAGGASPGPRGSGRSWEARGVPAARPGPAPAVPQKRGRGERLSQ